MQNSYSIKLSSIPHDPNFLRSGVAERNIQCGIAGCAINTGDRYYYFDSNGEMTPKAICSKHKFMFTTVSLNRPYWPRKPSINSCSEIRATGDKGIREFTDDLEEWDRIWGS